MTGGDALHLSALPIGVLPVPAWVPLMGDPGREPVELTFYVWLVTDGSRVGLVDLGLPLDPADLAELDAANSALDPVSIFRDVTLLPQALEAAGVTGADIDFVAFTQLVTYHTGGLDAGMLPNATVYLPMAGLRDMLVTQPGHPPTSLYFTRTGWESLRRLAVEGRLVVVEDSVELMPGVVYDVTGGHHPGSCAMRVRTADGVVAVLETAFTDENIRRGVPIGIAEDASRCRAVIRRYSAECDLVVGIHDPANSARFPLPPGDSNRLTPFQE